MIHPAANGFIPPETKILIIGTFPPDDQCANVNKFFFYGSARNHFWNRIDNIKGVRLKRTSKKNIDALQNRRDKENLCSRYNLGFIDVFTKIQRRCSSSKDQDLKLEDCETILSNRKFFDILKQHPIKRICCTYKLAYETIKSGLEKEGCSLVVKPSKETANGEKLTLLLNGKQIEIVRLFPATRSAQKAHVKDQQYKKFLFPDINGTDL